MTAQRILDAAPSVIQVVPLTKTIRGFASEVRIEPDAVNGLDAVSAAQCQHIRAVSTARADSVRGNVGALHLSQIRELLGTLLDIAA